MRTHLAYSRDSEHHDRHLPARRWRPLLDLASDKGCVLGYELHPGSDLYDGATADAIKWTKRFVQVDAPGRLNAESECELSPFFEYLK